MAKAENDWTVQQECNLTEEVDRSDGKESSTHQEEESNGDHEEQASEWDFDIQAWTFYKGHFP